MIKCIKYFEEKCINRFEKLEDEFIKDPLRMAEYVIGLTKELHELGLYMIKEYLPKAVGAEYDILTGGEIMQSENRRHRDVAKYSELIHHSISTHNKKAIYFNSHFGEL